MAPKRRVVMVLYSLLAPFVCFQLLGGVAAEPAAVASPSAAAHAPPPQDKTKATTNTSALLFPAIALPAPLWRKATRNSTSPEGFLLRGLGTASAFLLHFIREHLLLLLPGKGRVVPFLQKPKGTDPASRDDDTTPPSVKSLKLKPRVVHFNVMLAGLSGLGKTTTCNELFAAWKQHKYTNGDEMAKKSHVQQRAQASSIGNAGGYLAPNTGGVAATAATTAQKRPPATTLPSPMTPTYAPPQTSFRPSLGRGLTPETKAIDASRVFEYHDVEANTVVKVTVIDTPGFGNNIDHMRRGSPGEHLVHCCVYFLSPHRFLEIDKHFLRHVQKELPVVPVVAKSDTLTNSELRAYRAHLVAEFKKEKIRPYLFLDDELQKKRRQKRHTNDDDDDDDVQPVGGEESGPLPRNREKGDCLAIIARDGFYPWGASRVHNPAHSDFGVLRDRLLSDHTERLIDAALKRYATYRRRALRAARRGQILKSLAIVGLLGRQVYVARTPEATRLAEALFKAAALAFAGTSRALVALSHACAASKASSSSRKRAFACDDGDLSTPASTARASSDDDDDDHKSTLLPSSDISSPKKGDDSQNSGSSSNNVLAAGRRGLAAVGGLFGIVCLLAPPP